MSDDDIENNRIISQDALDKMDLEWIKIYSLDWKQLLSCSDKY